MADDLILETQVNYKLLAFVLSATWLKKPL